MRKNKLLSAAAFLISATFFTPSIAAAPQLGSVDVIIDQTQLVYLKRPMGSIIVGNPDIATVAVHDDHTLLLTGISFGTTNLIVLDGVGRKIYSSQLMVTEGASSGSLTVARGTTSTEVLACSDKCRVSTAGEEEQPDVNLNF